MKRILFVDDEINVLDGIRRMLRGDRHRWEMEFANSGLDALRACEAGGFDVVISDMRMPEMDGATLLGHVRDRYPASARCILSGYSEEGLTVRVIPVAHRVLTKPFKGTELQAAIECICSLQEVLCTPELRRTMGSIGELPSLSRTFQDLTQAVRDPAATTARIAGIVEHDVAMAAKVLQLVNSGFFGLAQHVSNIENAVQFLGMETIKNLALASETFRLFAPGSCLPRALCDRMQEHSERTAAIAGALPIAAEGRDIVLGAALLHDIGRLVLASRMPEQFREIIRRAAAEGRPEFEVEEAIFGISHAEIGAYLLGLWGLDALVVEAIAFHHRPARIPHTGLDASAVVYIASLLAREISEWRGTGVEALDAADLENLTVLGVIDRYPEWRERARQIRN